MAKGYQDRRTRRGPEKSEHIQRQDPWRLMLARALKSSIAPCARVLLTTLVGLHRDMPRFPFIRRGFGGRTEWVDTAGRVHHCRPGLAEATGMSRRSMIRARDQLVQLGLLGCRRGGGLRHKRCDRQGNVREIGNGGRAPGGEGLACEYFLPVPDPAPTPAPAPSPAPGGPRRPLGELARRLPDPRGP